MNKLVRPVLALAVAALVTGSASRATLPPLASGKLKGRFAILSQRHTNECLLTPAGLDKFAVNGRLQGSCCGPMKYADYVRQINGLKAFADNTEIPSSSPIRWYGLYIAAYQPLASVFSPYSRKQARA